MMFTKYAFFISMQFIANFGYKFIGYLKQNKR